MIYLAWKRLKRLKRMRKNSEQMVPEMGAIHQFSTYQFDNLAHFFIKKNLTGF